MLRKEKFGHGQPQNMRENKMNEYLFDNFDGKKMASLIPHWSSIRDNIIPTPLANSLDLSSHCSNKCWFCNHKFSNKSGLGHLSDETFAHLIDVYKHFGVKSSCISGGGESLENPRCEDYFEEIIKAGTAIGIITNGRIYRKVPKECRFINVSVNAADETTYSEMACVDKRYFFEVLENIGQWVNDGHCVTYKVMITDKNMSPGLLIDSVKMADSLGVENVLFRFAMLPYDQVNKKGADEYIHINTLESELYTSQIDILRKNFPDMNISMPFERYDRYSVKYVPFRCIGALINFVVLWDGNIVLCSDWRTSQKMVLCHISELKEQWGSQKHWDIVNSVDPTKCCRCSFSIHARLVEELIFNDYPNQFFI